MNTDTVIDTRKRPAPATKNGAEPILTDEQKERIAALRGSDPPEKASVRLEMRTEELRWLAEQAMKDGRFELATELATNTHSLQANFNRNYREWKSAQDENTA